MSSIYILILIAIVFCVLWTIKIKNKYNDEAYLKNLSIINQFFSKIETFNDYVTWKQRDEILEKYYSQFKYFHTKTKYYSREPAVKKFNEIYGNFREYINNYNDAYVDKTIAKNSNFFDNIEGKSLDHQQREAVVTDEYSNLVIAGAGSGKTLTILGKVFFLTKIKKIEPGRILLMSFTRKTVEDLNARLKEIPSAVEATTFHKLGLKIITDYEGWRPNVANEGLLGKVVTDYLQTNILSHPDQIQALIQFIACYLNIPEDYDAFQSAGERFDFYKGSVDYETLLSKVHNSGGVRQTLTGEYVRSVEELMIANFFFLNGINYEYEKRYPYSSFPYHPDFYLPDYDIWLEHFGINEQGKVPWLNPYDEQKYIQQIYNKREVHHQNNTTLLETYSFYNKEHRLLSELESMLLSHGVQFRPIDTSDIYAQISQNHYFGSELVDLIISFINLCKSRNLSEDAIKRLLTFGYKDKFMVERARLFFTFVAPIMCQYQKILDENKSIDFHDMINRAADIVQKHGNLMKYDYIIIDEYQDISYSRFNLVSAIRDFSNAKLLCVGDDWQSIYRFAGSDVSLFSKFGQFVGEYKQLLIEQTFRNSQELVDVASHFIQKNPLQIKKMPKSAKHLSNPISFVQYDASNFDKIYQSLLEQIKYLLAKYGSNSSIMILGRHNFDIDTLLYLNENKTDKRSEINLNHTSGKLTLQGINCANLFFSTVHKSKGLQADNVIILNLVNSQFGFPNKLTDDPILAPLLSEQEIFCFAEERRLFYVALTRTKNEVILLSPNLNESEFFTELLQDSHDVILSANNQQVSCPWCETGKLVVRTNLHSGEQFLGCSHYPQCNQTYSNLEILKNPIRCPRCGSGFLVRRSGRYGDFLGCTNWLPNNNGCVNTIKL